MIVWKNFEQAYTLEGHTAAVWAVLAIEDDLIVTGWKLASGNIKEFRKLI